MHQSKSHSSNKFTPLKEQLSNNSFYSLNNDKHGEINRTAIVSSSSTSINNEFDKSHNQISMIGSNYNLSTSSINISITDNDYKNSKEPLTTFDDNGITLKVFIGTMVCLLTNSFPSGYNIGVLNLPEQIFKSFFNQSLNMGVNIVNIGVNDSTVLIPVKDNTNTIELLWSFAVSVLVIGAMITSLFTGYLANHFGRRKVIFLNIMLGLISMCMQWLSKYLTSIPIFMAGRLIAGFHTGIASSIVPMYLMEISPESSHSLFGTLHIIALNGGLCFAQIMGLENLLGSMNLWQLLFFVNALAIILGLIGFYFIPESPVYLFVIKHREDLAIKVLERIRKSPSEVAEDLSNLRREQKSEESNGHPSLSKLFKQPRFLKGLLVVCLLHAGQQLVGINAVFYYSTNTFRNVGLSQRESQFGSIGCSLLNTLCALLASKLLKKFSLRTMLLISTIGTCIGLFVLPISMTFNDQFEWLNYVTIAMMYLYVFMFAIGQGPIPFMIGGKLFDSASMSSGLSIGVFINWFCNSIVAFTFPLLVIGINQNVFYIFLIFDLLLLTFILIMVPKSNDNDDDDTGIRKKPLENSISE